MSKTISLVGKVFSTYIITSPRELLFDGDGPPIISASAETLEKAREKASSLEDSKIYLRETVTVEGFAGILSRSTEVAR